MVTSMAPCPNLDSRALMRWRKEGRRARACRDGPASSPSPEAVRDRMWATWASKRGGQCTQRCRSGSGKGGQECDVNPYLNALAFGYSRNKDPAQQTRDWGTLDAKRVGCTLNTAPPHCPVRRQGMDSHSQGRSCQGGAPETSWSPSQTGHGREGGRGGG